MGRITRRLLDVSAWPPMMAVLHGGEGVDTRIWLHFFRNVWLAETDLEREELHTREGATETKIGSVSLGVFDSSVSSGHQLCTGTSQIGLFWLGTLTERAARVHERWRGSLAGFSAACVLRGPGPGDLWAGHRAKIRGSWNFGLWLTSPKGQKLASNTCVYGCRGRSLRNHPILPAVRKQRGVERGHRR